MVEIGLDMRTLQQIEVVIELTVSDENRAEALDGHVGQRIKPVEHDPVTRPEHPPVILLERALWRWQR